MLTVNTEQHTLKSDKRYSDFCGSKYFFAKYCSNRVSCSRLVIVLTKPWFELTVVNYAHKHVAIHRHFQISPKDIYL